MKKKEITLVDGVNNTIKAYTERIYDIGKQVSNYSLEISYLISEINEKGLYKSLGYKKCADYAKEYFGFSSSAVYNMMKVGKQFVKKLEDGSYRTIFYDKDTDSDFNMSQCAKMLSLTESQIRTAIESKSITFETSAANIQKVVNGINNPEKLLENKKTEENKKIEENKKSVENKTQTPPAEKQISDFSTEEVENAFFEVVKNDKTIIVHDIAGDEYAVPESILVKYKIKRKGSKK